MPNRIERLKTTAVDTIDGKESLNKSSLELNIDKSLVSELLGTLSDDTDVSVVEQHGVIVDTDLKEVTVGLEKNSETISDISNETDVYLANLEDNLSTLEKMKESSDLISDTSGEASTKKRIEELESIKSLLGEESETKTTSTAFDKLFNYMSSHEYGINDFDTYSRDPEWQRLHKAAYPEHYKKLLEQNAINLSALNTLSDDEMSDVIKKSFALTVDNNQNNTDTQRFFNAIGWSDRKPMILDNANFESNRKRLNAITIYHTDKPDVDSSDAREYAKQFMSIDAKRSKQYLSNGVHGDGTYFSNKSEGAWFYGGWNPGATQIKAYMNENARIMSEKELDRLVDNFKYTHPSTFQTLHQCKQGYGSWSTDGIKSVIAAINGYNVILSDGFLGDHEQYFTILDRSAVTVCNNIMLYKDVNQDNISNW